MGDRSGAHEALLNYQQADMDGIMVLVSRQAIHEVSEELDRAKDQITLLKHAAKEMGFDVLSIGNLSKEARPND